MRSNYLEYQQRTAAASDSRKNPPPADCRESSCPAGDNWIGWDYYPAGDNLFLLKKTTKKHTHNLWRTKAVTILIFKKKTSKSKKTF